MKRRDGRFAFLAVGLALLMLALGAPRAGEARTIEILHTNDTHSHLLGFGPNEEYDPTTTGDGTLGGIARHNAVILEERGLEPNTIVVNSGDYTMGTLFHVASTTQGLELFTMQLAGYDVVTLGNHEFDWGPAALAAAIAAAQEQGGGTTVPIVASNIKFDADSPDDDLLEALYGEPGEEGKAIYPYYILDLPNGMKVGVIGIMGLQAAFVAPLKDPVSFSGESEEDFPQLVADTQAAVDNVRSMGVDAVVCLAHVGVSDDLAGGESLALAQAVTGIDFLISGHNHTVVPEPIAIPHADGTTTYVSEAGSYGVYVGKIVAEEAGGGEPGFTLVDGESGLTLIDSSITAPDSPLNAVIDVAIAGLEADFLGNFGYTFFQTLCTTDFALESVPFQESNLEDMVTDAMRYYIDSVLGPAEAPSIAVHANGVVRDAILPGETGNISVADAFRVSPLGIGTDQVPGFNLLRFYLLAAEVRGAMEVGVSEGLIYDDFFLNYSGVQIYYDPGLPPYDTSDPTSGRIVRICIGDDPETCEVVFDRELSPETGGWLISPLTTLWAIETDEYIASFMDEYGLSPRDASGATGELSDFYIMLDETHQAKEWMAIFAYLQQMQADFGGMDPTYANTTPTRVIETEFYPLGVRLTMPSHTFTPGDEVYLTATVSVPEEEAGKDAFLVVLLDVGIPGEYWFWPNWRHYPYETPDFYPVTLETGREDVSIIDPFTWPQVSGEADGLFFYGALLSNDGSQILGDLGTWEFGYSS
jgi:5'-nucleotidase